MRTETLVPAFLEYATMLAFNEDLAEINFEDREALEWAEEMDGMRQAEENAWVNSMYDPEAQVDLAYPTYAELMELDS